MSDLKNNEAESTELKQPKKINLAEAIKQKLAEKKNVQANQKYNSPGAAHNKKLQNQHTKKVNNMRKKMGS